MGTGPGPAPCAPRPPFLVKKYLRDFEWHFVESIEGYSA